MYYGEKRIEKPIRWAMVGGGRGSQTGYIHRSSALRDFNFELVAGAFDIDPEKGKAFGRELHVSEDRCYPDYKTMFAKEAVREDGIQAVSVATPNGTHYEITKAALRGSARPCGRTMCAAWWTCTTGGILLSTQPSRRWRAATALTLCAGSSRMR